MIDWQIIIKEHGPVVWQTAYRLLGNHADAADCFQETFVSALEFCQHQRVRNFSALLARLATTRAIDQLRRCAAAPGQGKVTRIFRTINEREKVRLHMKEDENFLEKAVEALKNDQIPPGP